MTRHDPGLLQSMLADLPVAVRVYECEHSDGAPSLRLITANRAALLLPSDMQAELQGRHGEAMVELCQRVASTGASASLGEVHVGEVEAEKVLRIDAFPIAGYVGVALLDVSELAAMRRRAVAYQAAIDVIPDIIFVKSRDGQRFLLCNQVAAEGIGHTIESIAGVRNQDVFPPELAERLDEDDARIAAGQEAVSFEETIELPGGLQRFVQTTKAPVRDDAGEPLFLIGWVRDLTDQRDTMARLTEVQAELYATIEALSTPVLPIKKGVLVVPLVGAMTSARGEQFMDALLEGIQRHRAKIAIIDITGMLDVDSNVASRLISATRAAALLGTECVLVGISPSIAETLVGLGVDLGAMRTHRDLEAGVAYALGRR